MPSTSSTPRAIEFPTTCATDRCFARSAPSSTSLLALTALSILLTFCAPARAQSDQSVLELRQENARLRDRIAQLEAQLAQSNRQVESLKAQNTALQRRLTPGGGGGSGPPTTPTPAPSNEPDLSNLPDDPFAAPDAMLRELRSKYVENFGDAPLSTPEEREKRIQDARPWTRRMSTELRRAVEWLVTVVPDSEGRWSQPGFGRDTVFLLQVLDSASGGGAPIGRPFPISVSGRDAGRLQANPDGTRWIVSGVFSATPNVNPERETPGLFETPALVGPFVEFQHSLAVRGLRPADERDETER